MLGVLADDIGASERAVGMVPMSTQLGYALGILLLAPLGDRYDRRRIILIKAAILTVALLLAGAASGVATLLAASLAIGLTATMAQDIIRQPPPGAGTASRPHRRHRHDRLAAGHPALARGQRLRGRTLRLARHVRRRLGQHRPDRPGCMAWPAALPSDLAPVVWRAAGFAGVPDQEAWRPAPRRLAQGLLSVGFSAFWSTLAIMLHGALPPGARPPVPSAWPVLPVPGCAPGRPHLGQEGSGTGDPPGISLAALSFAAMALSPWFSTQGQLVLLALAAIGFDLGVQATLVSHQTIVYGIEPGARSRLNAVLFVGVHRHGVRCRPGQPGPGAVGLDWCGGPGRGGCGAGPGGAHVAGAAKAR
jgi:MFS family permease